jgi:hypothetical protein
MPFHHKRVFPNKQRHLLEKSPLNLHLMKIIEVNHLKAPIKAIQTDSTSLFGQEVRIY